MPLPSSRAALETALKPLSLRGIGSFGLGAFGMIFVAFFTDGSVEEESLVFALFSRGTVCSSVSILAMCLIVKLTLWCSASGW